MTKTIEVETPTTDAAEIERLTAAKMMIQTRAQNRGFLPDDDPKDMNYRRPMQYWQHQGQTHRMAFVVLPEGIKRHQDLYEHPLVFSRIQQDRAFKLAVLDAVMFISHDCSWVHEARVVHASDRVSLKPLYTEAALDWSKPSEQTVRAA